MAETKKIKKTAVKKAAAPVRDEASAAETKRRLRLGFGIFLLLLGVFTCFAIVSYFFTWKADQDKLFIGTDLWDFIFNSKNSKPVANWGGRLGAALSHLLVYRGAGVASLVIGVWVASVGLNMLYGKRVIPLMKYLRLFSMILLLVAPVLAYTRPVSDFPWGGAWGNEAIIYLNGLLGKAGTGLLLAGAAVFFLTVVFALDFRPFARKAKRGIKAMADAATGTDEPLTEEDDEQDESANSGVPLPATGIVIEPLKNEPKYDITLSEKEVKKNEQLQLTEIEDDYYSEPETEDDEEEEQEETAPIAATLSSAAEDFSFEVVKREDSPAAIKNVNQSIQDKSEPYAPELDLPQYKFPTLDLLEERHEAITLDKEELEKNKNQIIQTLKSFGIEIQRISATVGPTVTLYEIVPAEGVRISKIRNLEDDIALNLAALGIRIIAPIPGKGTIGIEVPNAHKQTVSMRALLSSEKFVNSKMSLPIALGKKIDNENYIVDLATMPHLLMAGATGQGKSVGINAILVSLLYKKHPSQLKFVMVDPKKVELSIYRTIEKHFLAKLPDEEEAIITDTKKVIYTLNALCIEMDNRYELLKEAGARNIKEYNEKFIARRLNPQRGHKYLPFIVLVIDEFADLIMTAGKEVEMPIARLAQLARAVGIHLIIATQRPSVNVITGTIKANFPGRIAFKVSAKVDSRTILDTGGADQLIGRGDMLVSHGSELLRVQCAFVDTPEVEKIVDFIGSQRGYPSAFELPEYDGEAESGGKEPIDLASKDALFEDCARVVVQTQSGSTSMLQRRFNLGYNRAGRIMDQLEAAGIVGPAKGSKPREVLYHTEMDLEIYLNDIP